MTADEHSEGQDSRLFLVWHLFVHILIGTFLFVLMYLAAVGLFFFVAWLEANHVTRFIVYGLKFAEYLIFVIDLILFVAYLLRISWSFVKRLW